MPVKLSQVTKLDGIKSWSLPAITTCPGARDKTGELVPVCQGCYARVGNYRFRAVQAVREHNRRDWRRPEWVGAMREALAELRHLRWFDSGDVYHPALAEKIHKVVRTTPWCRHWIPTRSHKVRRLRPVLERINAEPNAVVRYSADEIDTFTPGLHGSVVISDPARPPEGVVVCHAYRSSPARCNGCRACWDKDVAVIAYPAHGRAIQRLLPEARPSKRLYPQNSPIASGAMVIA